MHMRIVTEPALTSISGAADESVPGPSGQQDYSNSDASMQNNAQGGPFAFIANLWRGIGQPPNGKSGSRARQHEVSANPNGLAPPGTGPGAGPGSQPYVSLDFASAPRLRAPFKAAGGGPSPDIGTLWGLVVLSLAYLHHSTSGFALPALLPVITSDLSLSDGQGALLTAGYTVRAVASMFMLIYIHRSLYMIIEDLEAKGAMPTALEPRHLSQCGQFAMSM